MALVLALDYFSSSISDLISSDFTLRPVAGRSGKPFRVVSLAISVVSCIKQDLTYVARSFNLFGQSRKLSCSFAGMWAACAATALVLRAIGIDN